MKTKLLFISIIIGLFFSCGAPVFSKNKNLALEGEITASSFAGKNYQPGKAIDNDFNSLWKAKSKKENQWLMVDLKQNYVLNQICQTFEQSDVWKFKIEGSVDKENWLLLVDKTKGGAGITFSESVKGIYRYVKLTILDSNNKLVPSSKELIINGSGLGNNLALGKHFLNHVKQPAYEPDKAADGDISTYWKATDTYPQSITVDLRQLCKVTAVQQIFKEYDNWKFKIEGSKNNHEWEMLLDKTQGDQGFNFNSAVEGNYHFIKLTVLGSSSGYIANSCELKVFGFEGEKTPDPSHNPVINLALNTAASTSSFNRNEYSQYKALDGNPRTFWQADGNEVPQWLCVDLGNPCDIREITQLFTNEDKWSFIIEGSLDKKQWELLADQSAGFIGNNFSQQVKGNYRYLRLTVLSAENGNRAGSKEFAVYGYGSPKTANWWEDFSGMTRYYPKVYSQTLPSIIDSLDIIQSQGFKIVELSAPYEGDPAVWGGLGATNNYAIDPSIGTMEDFERLIKELHARDMKIIFFGNVGYCWHEAPFFQKACEDQGKNADSKERKWFHFSQTKHNDSWFWNEKAKAYYYSAWGNTDGAGGRIPSYNFNNQEWRDECKNYLNFWAAKGIDGLLLDAPEVYDGINDAIIEEYIIKVLNRHGMITNAEGSWDVYNFIGRFRFNSIQGFDLYGWGGGKRSDALAGRRAQTPAGLDEKLKNYRDIANSLNGVTITPPMWEIPATPEERIFETAYLSTLGTILVNHYGDHHREYIAQFILPTWSKEQQEAFYNLIRTQNSYTALAPSGQRICLPTNDDTKYTAFKRTNKDGNVAALVVFNFRDTPQTISVDIKNTGISQRQVPVDLLTGQSASPISSDKYEISLPAYGYAILGVQNEL